MRKTEKKVVSLCLVLWMVASMLISCGKTPELENPAAVTDGVKLWWAYNTENLMQDFTYDYDRDSTLRFYGIKATFFVTDSGYYDTMRQIVADGHSIGIHTVNHDYNTIYSSRVSNIVHDAVVICF